MPAELSEVPELNEIVLAFPGDQELRNVVMALAAVDRVYSHLAWLQSALDEAQRQISQRPPSELLHTFVAVGVARRVLGALQTEDFNPSNAVAGTSSAAFIITARKGNSWLVELLGKLNPITALESLAKTARDWKLDKEHKSLQNSKLAVEIFGLELQNQALELALVRDTIALLKEAKVPDDQIGEVLMGSFQNLASPLLVIVEETKSIERKPIISIRPAGIHKRVAKRPGVWDTSNPWSN